MPHRDEVLQVVDLPQRNRDSEHHRESGVDSAGNEVWREDRRMPAGYHRDAKSKPTIGAPTHQRVRFRPEADRQSCSASRAPPSLSSQGEQDRRNLRDLSDSAITQRRQIGNQPTYQRGTRLSHRSRPQTRPTERRAELRPHFHRVRNRKSSSRAWSRVMQSGKTRAGNREQESSPRRTG